MIRQVLNLSTHRDFLLIFSLYGPSITTHELGLQEKILRVWVESEITDPIKKKELLDTMTDSIFVPAGHDGFLKESVTR